jgi:hypothetical protein
MSLAAALVTACGSGGSTMTPAEFCAKARAAFGANGARCAGGSAADWTRWDEINDTPCATLDTLVAKKTIAFHPERAEACLAEIAKYVCLGPGISCFGAVLEGKLLTSGICTSGWECDDDSYCGPAPGVATGLCPLDVCTRAPAVVGDDCKDEQFCFRDLTCLGDKCVADHGAGEACGDGLPACASGLSCGATSMTCVKRTDAGPCASSVDCTLTSFCHSGACAPRLALGAPCDAKESGCAAFSACHGGACVPAGHLGQPCALESDAPIVCLEGQCDGETCVQRAKTGEACAAAFDCASSACDTTTMTCAACPS